MKTKELLFTGLIFLFTGILKAQKPQEKYLGITAGITTENLFYKCSKFCEEKAFLIGGLLAEFSPKKAMLSFTTGAQYLSVNESIMIPLNLNVLFGKEIKFKMTGGLIPLFRLNPVYPNKNFDMGKQIGIEIGYALNPRYIVFTDFGIYFVPELEYSPSHFGYKNI